MTVARRAAFLLAAEKDLERLRADDPALPSAALRTLRDVVNGTIEGAPLNEMAVAGDLSDCRKLYFGPGKPPSHRIVYRLLGDGTVEVIEVVAVEAREDMYAYLLAATRLQRLPAETKGRFNRIHQGVIRRRGERRR